MRDDKERRITGIPTRKREHTFKVGVTQAQYDILERMNKNRLEPGTGTRIRLGGHSMYHLAWDKDKGGLYISEPPDPMSKYYVIFEPTITRKVVEQQTPANPGIRLVAASTYGTIVPVSIGRRVVTGNIIDAEPITPRLEGAYEYTVEERTPVYAEGTGPE